MEKLFLEVLNRSITAGILILAVLLLRPLLKRAPRKLAKQPQLKKGRGRE